MGILMNAWKIDRRRARIQLDDLVAAIDLTEPARGLAGLRVGNDPLDEAALLGVEVPPPAAPDRESLSGARARGTSLTAAYRGSADWPIGVEATWRAEGPSASGAALATLALMVSVETQVLDARPELAVASVLPTTDVLRLVDAQSSRFESAGGESPRLIEPSGGPGCLLFRFPQSDFSYAEMVHPLDFLDSRLAGGTGPRPTFGLRHRLFGGPLEKGVIRRARVYGVFLPRDGDAGIAVESYARFAAAEPPLGA